MYLIICPKCKKQVNSIGGVPPKKCNYCGADLPSKEKDQREAKKD